MKTRIYNALEAIKVYNWYNGEISAFYAFSNGCTISKIDAAKVRRCLHKIGAKASIIGGVIISIDF